MYILLGFSVVHRQVVVVSIPIIPYIRTPTRPKMQIPTWLHGSDSDPAKLNLRLDEQREIYKPPRQIPQNKHLNLASYIAAKYT